MSGWIKVDKALTDTIKFRRVVRAIKNSNALRGVTDVSESTITSLVIGALVRLWVYADTHIADDDTLAITVEEIDDLVGVQGFAQALPAEWLHVIDADHVQLPDFLDHNGSSEKLRRQNATRQANYRHRNAQRNVTRDVTPSNTRNDARPDQTRPEETRPENTHSTRVELAPRGTLSPEFSRWLHTTYPHCTHQRRWTDALHFASVLVGKGSVTEEDLRRRVTGYRAFVDGRGVSGPDKVTAPQNWFNPLAQDPAWAKEWAAPPTKAQVQQDANINAGQEWLRQSGNA